MFSIKLRQLFIVSNKLIVRNVRSRGKRLGDPGIRNRLQAFKKEKIPLDNEDVEEYIEESESDFFNVGAAFNEHINETLIGKHELRNRIVKDKYFKENMPNLLTWSEKEQIRHLATTEPDEWTPQKIAESFPVTEQVVKRLLKFPWKPSSLQRIERHDASAMRNWKQLKEGTLEIPEDLRQHFLKFSNRTIPPLNPSSINIDVTPKDEKIGEFEEIIRRCAEKETSNSASNETKTKKNIQINETNSKEEKNYNNITLEELATDIRKRIKEGHSVNLNDKLIVDSVHRKEDNVAKVSTELDLIKETKHERQLAEIKEPEDQVYNVTYAERIRIPKKAYKKGATYKVNDCFYDDDGRFLYRVIGLTDSNNRAKE
ncbi:neugrin [Aricia agestis]|uniref:neugrin n=1 Tax=Aricia agestis TaxID=91739 RepID=UPI001C204BD5|nr:neugrin [Aricia agestis]